MKRGFGDEQIIGMVKNHEAGLRAKGPCRKHGIGNATFHKCGRRRR